MQRACFKRKVKKMSKLRFWLGHLEDVLLESPMTGWLERHPVLAPITLSTATAIVTSVVLSAIGWS